MDLSYALSTTLVDWSDARNLTEGLAKPVNSSNEKEIALQLKPEAKWSDGTSVTADQVVRSINHAKELHEEILKGLFESVKTIEAKDERTIVFHLNRPIAQSQILHKLTEPVYGVVFIGKDGTQDLSKTTGPYFLKSGSQEELTLEVNTHWYAYQSSMPKKVVIRQPRSGGLSEEEGFANDPWPNLRSSSSLMSKASEASFQKQHYSIWNRNLDRLFFISPSIKMENAEGRQLVQAINQKLDRSILLKGLSGYHLSQQFFPPGYVIFDPEFKSGSIGTEIPERFLKHPLHLLAAESRVGQALKANITAALKQVTGQEPVLKVVPLNKLSEELKKGQYDLALLSVAVNDPNVEGPVSFLFGDTPPAIRNGAGEAGNYKAKVARARTLEEKARNAEYRHVFTEATNAGCVLPLFHFSSIVVAREGIDLSGVPTTDETVAFAKIRFK